MTVVSEFPRPVRVIEHVMIPLADGTRLAAKIWLPRDAERAPVPAILEYLPYRKRDGTHERDALTHPYLAGHGYAGVRVDIRGSGESDGLLSDEYSRQEQDDALEVIAWLAAQPWCSGAVGMMGISWGGFNALQVAARRPAALKAIVTICSTDDRYADDVHFMGGAVLTEKFGWAGFLFSAMAHPPDPELVGEQWRAMWLKRLHQLPFFLEPWLRHQRRDGYWRHGSVCEDYAAIACPVYAVGGWTDGYTNAIPRLLQGLTVPRKGLIGPWAHAYPHIAKPGPQVGFLQEMLRWWDHWLKDIDDGLMSEPMLRAWMIDGAHPARHHETLPGYWTSATEWPPTARATLPFFLTDAGLREDRAGSLSPRAVCTPQTVGKQAGQWCPFGRGDDEAGDQREDDRQSVVFDSQVLGQEVQVLGAPVAEFEVESDRPVATLVARLCDVHPSGEPLRVSFGVLNLTHRDGHAQPAALEPGRRYRVRMQLNDAGAVFPAGHRIRLALSTTYWPMLWPAPQKATVTIHQGRLDLPMRTPGTEGLRPMPPPHTSPPEPTTVVRPGTVRIERLGLELSTQGKYEFSLEHDDPLSATALMHRTQAIRRGSWQVEIETRMRWTCSRDSFFLEAGLRACEGAEEIVQRTWKCTVARDLV